MEVTVDKHLTINRDVIISKLRDGKRYILLKYKSQLVPLFFKDNVIELMKFIKENRPSEDEIYHRYGSGYSKIVDLLAKYRIINEESNDVRHFNIDFKFKDQINKLNYLAFKTRTPLLVKIELTYNCNYKCKYCYVDGIKEKMMSLENIKVILNKLKDSGVNEIFITGGEPFLHPNIMDIIDYCERLEFITTVQTNASLITEEMVRKIKKYIHVTFGISFHSLYEEKFDAFTQVNGAFSKTMKAVKLLKRYDIPFYLKLPITRENQKDIEKNIDFFKKNKYDFQIYSQILPNVNDTINNSKFEVEEQYLEILYEKGYLKFSPSACSALKTKAWVSSKGDLYPCELVRISLGNLITDDFNSIWEGKKADEVLNSSIYTNPSKCEKCDKSKYCNKCLAYLTYKSWKTNLDYFCKTASIIKGLS